MYTVRVWYFFRMHTNDSATTRFAYLQVHETTVKIVMAVGALSMMGYFVEWQHVSAGVMLWWLGLIGANQV